MDDAAKAAMRARALVEQGAMQRQGGNLAAARGSYARAAEIWRGVDAAKYAHALRHVADVARQEGQLETAETAIAEVVGMYRERAPGGPQAGLEMANALRVLALVKQQMGSKAAARALWQETLPLYRAAGVKAGVEEAEKRLLEL